MAETYDTDPHEHEGEYGDEHHDHDAAGEDPSDYDVSSFSEESGATADVEHNEEIMSPDEKAPRRSPLLPIIAVVGGVALLGGVAWWQFGVHSQGLSPFPGSTPLPAKVASANAPPSAQTQPIRLDATPPPTPVLPVTPRVAAETSPAIIPAPVDQALPSAGAAPPKDAAPVSTLAGALPVTPAAQPTSAAMLPAPVAAQAPTPAPLSIQPGPVPAKPSPAPVAAVAQAQPAPVPLPLAAAVQEPPKVIAPSQSPMMHASPYAAGVVAPGAAANPADKAQIDALNAHIADLQAKLDRVNQQLGNLQNMVAATANPSQNTGRMPARVVAYQRYAGNNAASAGSNPVPDLAPEQDASTAQDQPVAHHAAKHARKHKTVIRHATEQAATTEPATPAAGGRWVLRAATPGHAWLATSMDSHDLKAVQVGDKVDGIGQVTEIQQQGSGWVVRGTRGTVH